MSEVENFIALVHATRKMIGVEIDHRRDLAGARWQVTVRSSDQKKETTYLFNDFDSMQANLPWLIMRMEYAIERY